MGFLDGLLGNASEIEPSKIEADFAQVIAPGEKIETAYQLIRDLFIFTNKRLILVDKQGFTGNKVEYHSLPYKNITHFSVETAGHFDLDAELKIWVSGAPMPIQKQQEIHRQLSEFLDNDLPQIEAAVRKETWIWESVDPDRV